MNLVDLYIDCDIIIYELFNIRLLSKFLFKFFLRLNLPYFRAG